MYYPLFITAEYCTRCRNEVNTLTRLADLQIEFEKKLKEGVPFETIVEEMGLKFCCRMEMMSPKNFNLVFTHPMYHSSGKEMVPPPAIPTTVPKFALEFPQ